MQQTANESSDDYNSPNAPFIKSSVVNYSNNRDTTNTEGDTTSDECNTTTNDDCTTSNEDCNTTIDSVTTMDCTTAASDGNITTDCMATTNNCVMTTTGACLATSAGLNGTSSDEGCGTTSKDDITDCGSNNARKDTRRVVTKGICDTTSSDLDTSLIVKFERAIEGGNASISDNNLSDSFCGETKNTELPLYEEIVNSTLNTVGFKSEVGLDRSLENSRSEDEGESST